MAINYASKYSGKIDERFSIESKTAQAVNTDYDFVGVKTVNVYSVPTAAMNDYTRSGANRYGTPEELGNTVQELTLSQDRSFTFSIDRGNFNDTQMTNSAGAALDRQIREVIAPEIDIYRLAKMAASAGASKTTELTKDNAYDALLDAATALTEAKVPLEGRIAYASAQFYKLIKEDSMFIKTSDMSQKIVINGQVGQVDGIALVVLPSSYLPANTAFIVTHRVATVSPIKLSEYKIHDNPPGINGWLVEGRVYYDAFVLDNKKDAIYVHKTA